MIEGYTKGKWMIEGYPNKKKATKGFVEIESGGKCIASVDVTFRPVEEQAANAQLIAKAPSMYEFIKEIHSGLSDKSKLSIWELSVKKECERLLK